ncbi:hypothetical protein [Streptomyces sp. NPDC057877]|uniref:hypothetical protein n=1 Tax=Streptomyces sp. NPDC057877 TaxID=3346269 RepID=UPI00367C970A
MSAARRRAAALSTVAGARRRAAALSAVAALCALTVSCGIPTTGVVEAGGPAGGVVPTVRVYFVAGGTLVAVPRRTGTPVEVKAALDVLFLGPTEPEYGKRITSDLPLLAGSAVRPPTPADPAATVVPTEAPQAAESMELVEVTEGGGRISVELSPTVGRLTGLAAAQIICTAVAAQRTADPTAKPAPVTVTGPGGRRVEGTGAMCPGL